MNDRINPYIAGAPVLEKRMFFGREDVFSWIDRSLSGKYVDHILVVHGQRRVGKTSVLKHLPDRLPERYIPVFIDLQGRTATTLPRFLWWLAREIIRTLKQERGIELPKLDREAFTADPEYFEGTFLPELEEKLGDHRLLLTFDEFDSLESTEAQEGMALPFMAILKRLMEHPQLNFVFSIGSSGRKLENMQAAYTNFFKQALYRKISFLGPEDGRELITRPVEGIIAFSDEAVDRILEITSGHPYFVQLMCHELFSVCQKSEDWHVSLEDVEAILDAVIERGTVNLKFVWDEASDLEKWALSCLSNLDAAVDLDELETRLREERVRFIPQDLENALLHLREKDVLTADNRFVIHLMRLWLRSNRPPEQVREELAQINPIVSRLLEIGQEYAERGDFQNAVNSYQEALAADEDNLDVRMSLAEGYLGQGDFINAVAAYRGAVELYPEDIAAQAGLCSALISLGDFRRLLGRLDDAQNAYLQVLDHNPQHSEARTRMAEVHHHKAVAAIAGGPEAALAEIERALEYTPDDEDLQKNVEALRGLAEGRKDFPEVLLAWSERARLAERWEEAGELISVFLRQGGEQASVSEPLEEIQQRVREKKIAELRLTAARLELLGEYEDAIRALREYVAFVPGDESAVQPDIERLEAAIAAARVALPSKPFWKSPLTWAAAILLAIIGFWLSRPGSPLMEALGGQYARGEADQQATETAAAMAAQSTRSAEQTATARPTNTPTVTPTPTPGIGSTSVSPRDGMAQMYVPEGTFLMWPEREVYLDAFWIDETEVTNGMYALCVSEGVCDAPSFTRSYTRVNYYGGAAFANYPVVYVSWGDANDYCAWAGRRLPTEAEWEKAARGTEGQNYPWGNQSVSGSLLNYCDTNCDYAFRDAWVDDGYADTAPVGSYPAGASPYGALDMAGNVWEWVADWYDPDYYETSPWENPQGPESGIHKVSRGGSWYSNSGLIGAGANRRRHIPTNSYNNTGFRCAVSH